jgi:3-oxoadipate enol-lactonase
MPHADLNGQRIFYEDSGGEGPPIVLAHGFLMDQAMFDPQVQMLAPEFRVIRFDERGFGATVTDGKPFTFWDSADDCIRLLDHLGLDRAVVGGMSQGGFLSLRAALRHPDRIRALVLMSTQAGTDDAAARAGQLELLETWKAHGPIEPLIQAVASMLLGAPEHWEPWVSKWRRLPKDALLLPSQCLMARDDLFPRLGEIRHPAIVFHGTADMGILFALGEALAKALPNCKGFVPVEGAAHAANLTHPHIVNPPLLEFLRTYGRAG